MPVFNPNRLNFLDHVATVAMKHFRVPMAMVSLVSESSVVIVGARGIPPSERPKDTMFCRLVASGYSVVVVPDAQKDERFTENPLVVESPYIRFMAGAPMITSAKERIGSLCIADTKPRDFGFGEEITLKQMSHFAADECLTALHRGQ